MDVRPGPVIITGATAPTDPKIPRGLIWQKDVGVLPAVNRQVPTATPNGTAINVFASIPVTVEIGRRYVWRYTGVAQFADAGAVGGLVLGDNAAIITAWAGSSAAVNSYWSISFTSAVWVATKTNLSVTSQLSRIAGTGAVTLVTSLPGGHYAELFDVGMP